MLNLPNFEYTTSEEVTEELRRELAQSPQFKVASSSRAVQSKLSLNAPALQRDIPIYQVDALVRRATALQSTRAGIEGRRGQTP